MSGIVKVYKFDSGFELIPRETLQDKSISLQALGLLANICSYPENWVLNKTELYKRFEKNKEASVRTAWNELLEAGYVMEKRERDGKKWKYEYAVRVVPFTEGEKAEFLGTGFSRLENEVLKMGTPKPSGNKELKEKNTKEENTQENNTNNYFEEEEGFAQNRINKYSLFEIQNEFEFSDEYMKEIESAMIENKTTFITVLEVREQLRKIYKEKEKGKQIFHEPKYLIKGILLNRRSKKSATDSEKVRKAKIELARKKAEQESQQQQRELFPFYNWLES